MVDAKKPDQVINTLPDYMEGFDASKVKKASEVEILPTISVDENGLEYAIEVKVLSRPHKIKLPKLKQKFGEVAFPMNVEYLNVNCQIYCTQALRFNIGVIDLKLYNIDNNDSIVGHSIRIWKELGTTEFGEQSMYKASLIK